METNGNAILPANKFYCEFCNYGTNKKSSFDDHQISEKHKKNKNITNPNIINETKQFICDNCNKQLKSRSGLWKHNQKCVIKKGQLDTIQCLLEENNKLKQIISNQNDVIIGKLNNKL
jgi:hypothetical protein